MREISISKINGMIDNEQENFIKTSDFRYDDQVEILAECVSARRSEKPIVFVAGPRGSGKKITARKLRNELEKQGVRAFLITLDNYLTANNIEEIHDFENPTRLDKQAFLDDMRKVADAKPIYVTSYSKQTSGYTQSGEIDFSKGDILIVEGLQALNPDVTEECDEFANFIYASVRTRIVSENGIRLHPSRIRLLRRIVRAMYSEKAIERILDLAEETQKREDRFVMPYKFRANYEIDTFIGYEASAYKPLIFPRLKELRFKYPLEEKFGDLMRFLGDVNGMPLSAVPKDSMIHEFMDGIK